MTTKQKQALLAYLGYYGGDIDGIWGQQSQQATIHFQREFMDSPDGIFGAATEKRILEVVASGEEPKQETHSGTETGAFWDEIQYFSREEFRCKCGGKYCNGFPAEPGEEIVRIADEIRRRAGVALNVNSGLRCKTHNAKVGGVSNSFHLTGQAVDLAPINSGISAAKLHAIAADVMAERIPGRGGLGIYDWGIHVDNGTYSRWDSRS